VSIAPVRTAFAFGGSFTSSSNTESSGLAGGGVCGWVGGGLNAAATPGGGGVGVECKGRENEYFK